MSHRWRLHRTCEPGAGITIAGLLVVCFMGLALTTRLLCEDQQNNSAFWPADAAITVALLSLPRNLGYVVCLACFIANILINDATGYAPSDNLLLCTLNLAVSGLVAFLTQSFCGATVDLTRIRRLAVFACICFSAAALEAGIGQWLSPARTLALQLDGWSQWTLCDGLGFLLATPAILLAIRNPAQDLACDAVFLERLLLFAATLTLDVAAFAFANVPLMLMIYPLLILTAFRAGPAWVLGSVLMASMIASGMTAHGYGPLVVLAHGSRLLKPDMMQPYIVSLFLSAVPANNALGEKNRTARRLRRLRAAIENDATHDALTNVLNRKAFRRLLAARARSRTPCSVLLIDLDHFKQVNDRSGHLAGDALLRGFAGRLASLVGSDATVARLGGDEFAVILGPELDTSRVEQACQHIAALGLMPVLPRSGVSAVSASVGVSTLAACDWDVDEALRQADVALYAAKGAGRQGYRFYDKVFDEAAREDALLQADLRAAIAGAGGLALHYQLKFDTNGKASGAEALLRWQHPERGMISPVRFIALAEASELIHPLGAWVFRQALDFASRWPHLMVAVNVSAVQLTHPGFLAQTLADYEESSPKPGQIELEVTETALFDEKSGSAQVIAALRHAGLRVALDDFGTGYSSLSHLTRLEIDRLKIDRSFVLGLSDSPRASAIVRNLIELGHAMALQVTAEGVETEAQRDFLLRAGVDELQGYLLAKPVDEASLPISPVPNPATPPDDLSGLHQGQRTSATLPAYSTVTDFARLRG